MENYKSRRDPTNTSIQLANAGSTKQEVGENMGRMPETEVSIAGKRFYLHGIPSVYFHSLGILNILMLLSDRLPTILSL